MSEFKLIPAIDIIDGKCVRLTMGDYAQKKTYNENPLEVAKSFEAAGLKYLHLVDLDGAKSNKVVNLPVLQSIVKETNLIVDFGGGIKSTESLEMVLDAGANQVTVGSMAVKSPALFFEWLDKYGAEKLILGADVRNELIAINGWLEDSDVTIYDFLKDYTAKGVKHVVCTDISKDGMLAGSSIELYKKLLESFPAIDLIASGGVTTIEEVMELKAAGLPGAIIGKAIYEGNITIDQLGKLQAIC
jgi:phosphoribosylformimino-5-aminoimidazole carboxamide ribotide isomerase